MVTRALKIFLLLFTGISVHAANFTISGNLQGISNQWLYLNYLPDSSKPSTVDSAYCQNGKFEFHGKINSPTVGILYTQASMLEYFVFDTGYTYISGIAENGNKLTVKGGHSTELFNEWNQGIAKFEDFRRHIFQYVSGPGVEKDSLKHAQYTDSLQESLWAEQNYSAGFIAAHPNSGVSAYLIYYKFSGIENITSGLALFKKLSPQVQQSKYAQQFMQRFQSYQQKLTGMPAADFQQADTSGKPVQLSQLKGKVVLLDFWASWCGPCRRENPGLVNIYKQYHQQGFEIISVSLDEKKDPWLKAIQHDNLSWINVCDFKGWDNDAAQLYLISSLPGNILIDAKGNIAARNVFGEGLKYQLQQLLK